MLSLIRGQPLLFLKDVSHKHGLQCQLHTALCVASLEETSDTEHWFALCLVFILL